MDVDHIMKAGTHLEMAAGAKTIEVYWGPQDSHLAFFRFREGIGEPECDRHCVANFRVGQELVAALDLELAEWRPPLQAKP